MIQKYIERFPYDAEIVEAVQFKDETDVILAISDWFAENGITDVRISYEDVMNTRLIFDNGYYGDFSAMTDWYIVKEVSGEFSVYAESAFNSNFEPLNV